MSLLLVLIGGAVGAPARFLIDRAVMRGRAGVMPWGTLVVNVIASFVLGVLIGVFARQNSVSPSGAPALNPWLLLVGTGFCGALSTYSTFGFENARLLEEGRGWPAVANIAGSLVATCTAVVAGLAIGRLLGTTVGD